MGRAPYVRGGHTLRHGKTPLTGQIWPSMGHVSVRVFLKVTKHISAFNRPLTAIRCGVRQFPKANFRLNCDKSS